ncbi:MAG: hypothetical protein ABI869_05925 [Actinomycetota bacterium]
MRQRFERVTRKHHPRDDRAAEVEVETVHGPVTHDEHLQQELERILELIDEALDENADLESLA